MTAFAKSKRSGLAPTSGRPNLQRKDKPQCPVWALTLDYFSFDGGSVVWLSRIKYREVQGEDGTFGELAGYAHATAHRFHHAFYQIKTKANASDLAISHAFGAIERFKNVRKIRGRDTDSFIFDADLHFWRPLIRNAARPQSHPAVLA